MDSKLFKQTVMPLASRMYFVALKVTCDEDDAKDAVQNAVIRLWESRHKLRKADNRAAFIMATARNEAINIIRQRHETTAIDLLDEQPADNDLNETIDRSDRIRIILDIIADLPPAQRQVIMMRDFEGYEFNEIEHHTGLSAVNVRTLLSRARKSIRKHFI